MIYKGTAVMPGSCGELVQGTISGRNFHVTCPVNLYSTVTVETGPSLKYYAFPKNRTKAARAVKKLLERLGCKGYGAVIRVKSCLPVGKGMASSTADIAAACYAVAAALNVEIAYSMVAEIALAIEPSDGLFCPGITLFDHVKGRFREILGSPPPVSVLVLDFGGEVDTLEFNRRPELPFLNRRNEGDTGKALELVRRGLQEQDPFLLGAGATMSALANQKILSKPGLEEIIDFVLKKGAYGLNVAHSGTVAGVLLPPGKEDDRDLISEIREKFPEIKCRYYLRLIKGGPRYPGQCLKKRGSALL